MRVRFSWMLLLTLCLSWTATAQSSSPMREGMWEVNTKMNIPGMGEMPPMKHQQCITAAMIKDPQSAHGQIIDEDVPEPQPVNGHPPDHETSDRKRADR